MKRTKIIATLGPATNNEETLAQLFEEGVDIIRLNGSHYRDKNDVQNDVELIRSVSKNINKHIAIFFDLQGPKIRIGKFKKDIQSQNADIGILVNQTMPKGIKRMGVFEGIYISFSF